jgi:hypothetical protein
MGERLVCRSNIRGAVLRCDAVLRRAGPFCDTFGEGACAAHIADVRFVRPQRPPDWSSCLSRSDTCTDANQPGEGVPRSDRASARGSEKVFRLSCGNSGLSSGSRAVAAPRACAAGDEFLHQFATWRSQKTPSKRRDINERIEQQNAVYHKLHEPRLTEVDTGHRCSRTSEASIGASTGTVARDGVVGW